MFLTAVLWRVLDSLTVAVSSLEMVELNVSGEMEPLELGSLIMTVSIAYYAESCCTIVVAYLLLFLFPAMIIGFVERRQTVSEGDGPPTADLSENFINVATLRVSEAEHTMLFQILPIGTANVASFLSSFDLNFDALFGTTTEGDPIEEREILLPGRSIIASRRIDIRKDFEIEDEECFSLRISPIAVPGQKDVFMCNDDETNSTDFFCVHTICIEDDDGKMAKYSAIIYIDFNTIM